MIVKWKIIAIALTVMLSVVVNVEVLAASNGQCGENVFWTLNDEGVLTISGSGEMTNYNLKGTDVSPWFRNANVVNVIIENGVTSIGDCAFYKCGSLSSVTIPNSVASIGSSALAGCLSLTSVVIPDGVTNIETSAFGGCKGLTSVAIGDGVTSVGDWAFGNCTGLKSVKLGNSVTSIGGWSFFKCSNLASIVMPEGVTMVGNGAFAECTSLASVTIPNSVTSIGRQVFLNCLSLTSVMIPNSVTSIGDCAFAGCSGLTKTMIPKGVMSIGKQVFYLCKGLKKSAYPSHLENPFENGISVVYPTDGIIESDGSIFSADKKVLCFVPMDVAEYKIPKNVTDIGDYAFRNCSSLRSIYAYAAEPPMCGKFTFEGVDKDLCKLYVLEESIPAYSTADEWKDFQTILLGVDTVSADGLNVVAVDGMIFIGGVADDAVVEVYSMGGALVYRGSGKSVAVPQAGVYIVSVAGSAVKVMAK